MGLGGSETAPKSIEILNQKEYKVYEEEKKARMTTADMEANQGGAEVAGLTQFFNT